MDLNSDLGESFGRWTLGDDAAMLDLVTSANVACGFHAGDPSTLRRTCALAAAAGVVVGAQVGYRDLAGFGRRFIDVEPGQLADDVVYQIGALEAMCRVAGTAVRYVKPHGALYNAIVHHERQAAAVVAAVRDYDPALPVLGLPGSAFLRAAEAAGLRTVSRVLRRPRLHPGGDAGARGTGTAPCCTTPTRSPSGCCGWSRTGWWSRSTAAGCRSPPSRCACTGTRRARWRWPGRCGPGWSGPGCRWRRSRSEPAR